MSPSLKPLATSRSRTSGSKLLIRIGASCSNSAQHRGVVKRRLRPHNRVCRGAGESSRGYLASKPLRSREFIRTGTSSIPGDAIPMRDKVTWPIPHLWTQMDTYFLQAQNRYYQSYLAAILELSSSLFPSLSIRGMPFINSLCLI